MSRSLYGLMMPVLLCVAVSCGKKQDVDQQAASCLRDSRMALSAGDYVKAKSYIDTLRLKYPTALNAREEGILLLDSINIKESKKELEEMEKKISGIENPTPVQKDTLDFYYDEAKEKVRFFERKLQHDLQNKESH